jgi:hypothetical protein
MKLPQSMKMYGGMEVKFYALQLWLNMGISSELLSSANLAFGWNRGR